jgi:hydroxymethylglutaryl-CoA lyase
MSEIKIIECPRDAMQGLSYFVDTEDKIDYLNLLLKVGFHTLDCGSFVSPKYIPQMRDTNAVLNAIDRTNSDTQLSVIVANQRGARDAAAHPQVDHIGFPFSVSETFQLNNTRKSIEESFETVREISHIAKEGGKQVVIYISMGFGNPYGDAWSEDLVAHWIEKLSSLGLENFSLSDTVGVGTPQTISALFTNLSSRFPQLEFGAHFHTRPDQWREKIDAAWSSGCRRYDGCLKGYGGCPMADDRLVGNMPTENLISFFDEQQLKTNLNEKALQMAMLKASEVFH